MSYHSETDDVTGVTLKIELDDGPTESPLEHDSAVIFASLTRNYLNPAEKPHGLRTQEDLERFERENAHPTRGAWAAFPLFMFEHSGTSYRVAERPAPGTRPANPYGSGLYAQFDSGRVGTLFVKLSEIAKRNEPRADKLAKAYECARVTCETYTHWANGDVFGFVVEDEDGATLDSCWGFIGSSDDEYLMQEARQAFEYHKGLAAKVKAESTAAELTAERPDLYPAN
jgi:hypothetical protein